MSNPYLGEEGKWYWYDETELASDPYDTKEEAEHDLERYGHYLNTGEVLPRKEFK